MTVFIEDSFDAAHWLPNVPDGHKCKRMHGHTYRVRLEVNGPVAPDTGWVTDYADIKAHWLQVKGRLDHVCLNDVMLNPTCELLAEYIGKTLKLSRVELRETEHCGCVWEAGR